MSGNTFLAGYALNVGWRYPEVNLQEWVFGTVRSAISRSGLVVNDVDSVVIAAQDLVDGRSLSSMLTATAAAGYLRDEVRVADDGAVALSLADSRINAGLSDVTVVAAWGRASESGSSLDLISNTLYDPVFLRPLGLTDLTVSAFRAQQMLALGRIPREDRNRAISRRCDTVGRHPGESHDGWASHLFPLANCELPRWADVCVALVATRKPTDIRVAGIGHCVDTFDIGERDLVASPAFVTSIHRAFEVASVNLEDIDLFELDALTLIDEAALLEALGLVAAGDGLAAISSDSRVNPSGGSAAGYCAPAMGLVRIVESVRGLRKMRRTAAKTPPVWALATGSTPVGAQAHIGVVMEGSWTT